MPANLDTTCCHLGVNYYAQIHGPIERIGNENVGDVDIDEYSIALEVLASDALKILAPSTPFPAWVEAYNTEVIQKDEKRMMGGFGRDFVVVLPPGEEVAKGVKRVIVRDGVVVQEYPRKALDKAWKIWREYETRGKAIGDDEERMEE